MKSISLAIFSLFLISTFGCYKLLNGQLEENIKRLEEAKSQITKNPHDKEALSVFLILLKDRNGINRSNAAVVLGQAGEKVGASIADQAVPPLIEMLDKGDDFDKRAAAEGLRGFGKYAKDAVPVLRKCLFPTANDYASLSAQTLGKIGEPSAVAVPDLIKAIKENEIDREGYESYMRESATRALGQIGPAAKDAVPDLKRFLNNTYNLDFKIDLAIALFSIDPNDKDGFSMLKSLLQNQNAEIRSHTIWSLRDVGNGAKPAIKLIEEAQSDKDEYVRIAASELLKVIDN